MNLVLGSFRRGRESVKVSRRVCIKEQGRKKKGETKPLSVDGMRTPRSEDGMLFIDPRQVSRQQACASPSFL